MMNTFDPPRPGKAAVGRPCPGVLTAADVVAGLVLNSVALVAEALAAVLEPVETSAALVTTVLGGAPDHDPGTRAYPHPRTVPSPRAQARHPATRRSLDPVPDNRPRSPRSPRSPLAGAAGRSHG